MTDNFDIVDDPDQIPTKELMKRRRREAYLQAKAKAKTDREKTKSDKQAAKEAERAARDAALWEAMQTGSRLEKNPKKDP